MRECVRTYVRECVRDKIAQDKNEACYVTMAHESPLSVRLIHVYTYTLPPGHIRGLIGVKSTVVTHLVHLCCGQP